MRITSKTLESLILSLNKLTNNPTEPYQRVDGRSVANVGNYHLSCAYGGYALHQMVQSGGVRDVLNSGHISGKELYQLICAYRNGMHDV